MLKDAVEERGLSKYVAKDGVEAARRLVVGEFDPLMGAHNRILENVVQMMGSAVLLTSGCPLCEISKWHTEGCKDPSCAVTSYDHWVDKAADESLEVARERGLLGAN